MNTIVEPRSHENTKVLEPELRFSEFASDWSSFKLGDISKFSKGKGISKADIDETGNTECIRYGQLYTEYGEVIANVISRTKVSSKNLVLSKKNDVIIPASGESSIDIATASCVQLDGIALGGDLNIIRTEQNGAFLAYYLNNKKKTDIAKFAQGNSVVHLYGTQLGLLSLNLPSNNEQQKIADFLSSVDKKIEQLTKKHRLLTEYKKGVMQQIFTQQIRFKDNQGNDYPEWEEKRLGSISKRKTEKNKDETQRLVLTNSAAQGIVSQTDYFDKDIANQNNLGGYYIVEQDDFVYNPRISVSAPVGPIKRNHLSTGVMSPLYSVFAITKGSKNFFERYFETNLWHRYMNQIANFGARHDRMNVTTADFYNMPMPFPCLEEQQKIANFLTEIDQKTDQAWSTLEQTKAFKKGLLQKMFV